jgi:superfamily II DNA or RNA helicase
VGLWSELYQIGQKYKIEVRIEGLEKIIDSSFTLEEFTKWCDEFFENKSFKPRDYQIETAWKIIRFKLSVSEVATSSGKTLIAFIVLAYLKKVHNVQKFLMVVPNSNLVLQGSEDFEEYGLDELENCELQQIHGSNKKKISSGLMIGTYQSLVKMEPEFFDGVEAVFVDECHQSSSASIKKVVALCRYSKWRFGLSGTLTNKSSAEYLTIQQFLGPLIMEISPKFLFDNKYATPVSIKIVKMNWLDEEVKEKLSNLKENKKELSELLQDTPIKDLRKAFGVNDRYLFINELFNGDEVMFDRSIKTINAFSIYPEAEYWIRRELKVKLAWDDKSTFVLQFDQLVKRRFA